MKKCVECGGTDLTQVPHDISETIAGLAFVMSTKAKQCGSCGARYVDGGAQEAFELAAAVYLAEAGASSGPALQFMRKALGMRAVDFAHLIGGVTAETISRWENEKQPIDHSAMVLMRLLVLEQAGKKPHVREQMALAGRPKASSRPIALKAVA